MSETTRLTVLSDFLKDETSYGGALSAALECLYGTLDGPAGQSFLATTQSVRLAAEASDELRTQIGQSIEVLQELVGYETYFFPLFSREWPRMHQVLSL